MKGGDPMTGFEKWVELKGQASLAEELGVTRQLVGQWINAKQRPSDKKKIEIVKLSGGLLDFNSFFR